MVIAGWLGYLLGLIISLVVAWAISPLFPPPISTIVFWIGIIAALVFLILLLVALVNRTRHPHDPV